MILATPRLRLRSWRDADRDAFASLHADPEVMRDYGRPLDRAASDAKLARYRAVFDSHGFTRWATERLDGTFLGYVGMMPSKPGDPLAPHPDIGWRLIQSAWGQGYATEAATAALEDAFTRCSLAEVVAYATLENRRSHAVMERLGLARHPARDFEETDDRMVWRCQVWFATAATR